MTQSKKLLGFIGSLRQESWNRKLLQAVQELVPAPLTLEIADISRLPLFNEDLEPNFPDEAKTLKQQIREASGIIIVTPEYNRSMPGVLKNAIDWTSRPYGDSAWNEKPVAVMGAAGGFIGTALAQYHLKQVLLYLNALVLGQPEFYLSEAPKKFDQTGKLTDQVTKEKIQTLLKVFTERHQLI